jgi:hypothetical protein
MIHWRLDKSKTACEDDRAGEFVRNPVAVLLFFGLRFACKSPPKGLKLENQEKSFPLSVHGTDFTSIESNSRLRLLEE